jgi:hypothetical protein
MVAAGVAGGLQQLAFYAFYVLQPRMKIASYSLNV